MIFDRKPELRGRYAGPYRSRPFWDYVAAIFVAVAKGTLLSAAIIVALFCALNGSADGLAGAPTTRKGRFIVLGIIGIVIAIAVLFL